MMCTWMHVGQIKLAHDTCELIRVCHDYVPDIWHIPLVGERKQNLVNAMADILYIYIYIICIQCLPSYRNVLRDSKYAPHHKYAKFKTLLLVRKHILLPSR